LQTSCRALCGTSVHLRDFQLASNTRSVLDEVTTHLDAPTIRALARALKAYSGGIILITHDRWFSTVVVEGKPVDEGDDESSDEDEDDGAGFAGRRGVSYLVDKGKIKVLENGMEEYEKLVERRLARRRAKEAAGAS
jgi:ATP-binding cassette subfamily F protein 3